MDVTDYRMSLHYGICAGPIDKLLAIYVGEKLAWSGDVSAESAIGINRPQLFGGIKKEGGVSGVAHYLPGGPTQVLPENLANKFGLTSATSPGFRGLASIFFHGGAYNSYWGFVGTGFMWGSNNPYLRSIWMKVRRSPKGLASHLRMIGKDANPAAIIYECLTNTDWGMGASPASIDTASFQAAAQILLDEAFGMSLIWTRQATIESFVTEIIDHIQATLFVNPRNGLLTLKMIRDDYSVGDLPVLDPDNCDVTSFDRKAWGETINEIVVTWTNPENEQEETVSAQDLANITIQGAVISDSRNYYGVRSANLAMRLAMRDLASASAPLASFEIEVDRSAWDFVPGGCAVLNYPEYGIEGLILRIGKIDYGKPGQAKIKVSAIEDIFSLPAAAYDDRDESEWEDPSSDPEAIDLVRVITTPAYFTSGVVSAADVATLAYPEVLSAILASQANPDILSYDVVQQTVLPNGSVVGDIGSTKPILGHCLLTDALPAAATSIVPEFFDVVGGTAPSVAGFLFIGGTTEEHQEIALIKSADESGWLLLRGVLDTVPRSWPAGTPVWFITRGTDFIDTSEIRSASETVRYKLLTRTSRGQLGEDVAPIVGTILSGRPHLPNRPANVKVGGQMFGTLDLSVSPPSTISITWANRNRLLEDTQVIGWSEAAIVPEVGQTTTVSVYRTDGTLITTHNGITGSSFSLPLASFGGYAVGDVKVTAKREGLESLQGAVVRVKVRPYGWGDNWGEDWGGGTDGGIPPVDPPPGGGGEDPDPGEDFPDVPWWKYKEHPIPE